MRRRTIVLAGALLASLLLGSGAMSAAPPRRSTVDHRQFLVLAGAAHGGAGNQSHLGPTATTSRTPSPTPTRPRAFKSPALDTGEAFSYVFSKPGTYHYFCSLHPHMQGTVVVR